MSNLLISHNTSGIKGIYWNKEKKGKWRVQITVNRKHKYLSRHDDFTEAVAHRFAAEQCLNWGDCDTNSISGNYLKEVLSGKSA